VILGDKGASSIPSVSGADCSAASGQGCLCCGRIWGGLWPWTKKEKPRTGRGIVRAVEGQWNLSWVSLDRDNPDLAAERSGPTLGKCERSFFWGRLAMS